MLDNFIFNEETKEIELSVENADTGAEATVTGPGVNEVFMIRVLLQKYLINSLSELEDMLQEGVCNVVKKNKPQKNLE